MIAVHTFALGADHDGALMDTIDAFTYKRAEVALGHQIGMEGVVDMRGGLISLSTDKLVT